MSRVRSRIEDDALFFDSAILSHGFSPFMRDYDVVIDVPALKPDGSGSYVEGRYRYRFTHCPEAHVGSTVAPQSWRDSWDEHFVDFAAWEQAGQPSGFVWGTNWADAYPGFSYVENSERASKWAGQLDREMHELRIETNVFELSLVFHDLRVTQLAAGDPRTGEMTPRAEK